MRKFLKVAAFEVLAYLRNARDDRSRARYRAPMPNTEEEIRATLHRLKPLSFVHTEGFTCFTQMSLETSGLEPEAAEDWILANGGHLKHVIVPSIDNVGRGIPEPDSEPCYFVPDALLS